MMLAPPDVSWALIVWEWVEPIVVGIVVVLAVVAVGEGWVTRAYREVRRLVILVFKRE